MAEGIDRLNAMILKLNQLEEFVEEATPEIAKDLEAELHKTIAAGTSFGGVAWTPKKDGTAPLKGASKALEVQAIGSVVVATLNGIEARHHKGSVRGNKGGNTLQRPILPTKKSLGKVSNVVKKTLKRRFRDIMEG